MPISGKDPFFDLCESNNVTIMLFEQLNRTLPRFLPKQFQLPDDTITFIETGATMFRYVDKFSDQVIKIFFRIGENNYYSFDIGLNYKDRPLPFYSEPVTKAGDHTFKTKEQIEHDNPKRLNPFKTKEQIEHNNSKRLNPFKIKRTPFEYATGFENLRIKEHKMYYKEQFKKLPEDQQRKLKDYNKNHPEHYKYMFLASKFKDDNLLNFIIRGIQTNILTFKDNDVYNKLIKLCRIGTSVNYYDNKLNSKKPAIEIIKSAIDNCKLPIDHNGFKKNIISSLDKQKRKAHHDEIIYKYRYSNDDVDKAELHTRISGHTTSNFLNYIEAEKKYDIPKTTFYRFVDRLKNELINSKYNSLYEHPKSELSQYLDKKMLPKEYCEKINNRKKELNDKTNQIEQLASQFHKSKFTIQGNFKYYKNKSETLKTQKTTSVQQHVPTKSYLRHPKRAYKPEKNS
jgi:hypothetical protein